MPTRRTALKALLAVPGAAVLRAQAGKIRHIDIIHHSHTDVGFTDLPSVTRALQVRFLDAALDLCLHDTRFRWTAEAMLTVDDWWGQATRARRDALLGRIRKGQIDIMALPFNQAPFMNALEWDQALAWVPDALWRDLRPRAAMQNDVNGFPRAGAIRLLDRGLRHLIMGINPDSGGPPFRRPTAFWWKMPDGRRLFVWMGDHYGAAYGYFEPQLWQRDQPKGANGTLRPPRAGEHLRTDEASLRACHAHCQERLQRLEAEGYDFDRLIISYTNQWRGDNDAPFPPLPAFVEAWNGLGLQPSLRLATATDAVRDMETAVGSRIRTLAGEWTDWWANGDASGPREVAASRFAKRYLAAALSPVWGDINESTKRRKEAILKDLCLFDEHTWGANISIGHPDGLDTIAQYTEKSLLAYRPMGHAEWLLGQRARTRLASEPEGLYITNTARVPFSGWVSILAAALRDGKTRTGRTVRFWVQDLAPSSTLDLPSGKVDEPDPVDSRKPNVETDSFGWPVSALWPGMGKSLFSAGLGDFVALVTVPPANRSTISRMHSMADAAKRDEMRAQAFKEVPASMRKNAEFEESAHTLVYSQAFEHPRLENAVRRLELWKAEPRARLTVQFDRISSMNPEVLYLNFAFPVEGAMPAFSNGGVPFVPYRDQIEGSCRDYYAIDGWAHYDTPNGHWLWVSRDAPLAVVGGPHTVERRTTAPADTHRLMSMVFDNCWHTNFVANQHGRMEFQFELAWRDRIANPAELAEGLVSEPVVVINPAAKESPEILIDIFRP